MPKRFLTSVVFCALATGSALIAQTQPNSQPGTKEPVSGGVSFEVASIRPAPSMADLPALIQSGKAHIGMSVDGGRVDMGFVSLADLIVQAYKIKPYQLIGPDWMKQQRFDIQATIPEGASKDEVPAMLQNLLSERFKLEVHRDKKEQQVYAMVIGKNGPKLKEAEPEKPKASEGDVPSSSAGTGKPVFTMGTADGPVSVRAEGRGAVITGGPNGATRMSMGENGNMRMEMSRMSMPRLADLVTPFVDRPVVDMTSLAGDYQIVLELPMQELLNLARAMAPELAGPGAPIGGPGAGRGPNAGIAGGAGPPPGLGGPASSAASDPSGTSIFQAIQQLGLRLESRKAPVATIVVDRLDKTPTEN